MYQSIGISYTDSRSVAVVASQVVEFSAKIPEFDMLSSPKKVVYFSKNAAPILMMQK